MNSKFTALGLLILFSCAKKDGKDVESSIKSDSVLLREIARRDSTNPCLQFKKLKTADDYFQSANNRTKDCPYDSSTNFVALKEYEYAVNLDPKFWQAKRNYARQLYRFKEYNKCIKQVSDALSIVSSKENPDLNLLRAQSYYALEMYEEAINDYNTCLKYMGNKDYTYLLKAKAEWKLGQKDKACEDYHTAVSTYPDYKKAKEFIDCE